MTVAVKICGLTDEGAVEAAIAAGADYAGFVYFPASPRHVTFEHAATLKSLLPSRVHSVSVMVDPDDALLAQMQSILKPDYVQLHGKESPERVKAIKKTFPGIKIIKAISVKNGDDVAQAAAYADHVDMLMFDAKPPSLSSCGLRSSSTGSFPAARDPALTLRVPQHDKYLPGGNALSFDWNLLKGRQFEKPWFLSGGLNADNVTEAIRISGAKMVDVSSGVESAPGVKDDALIKAFVKAARHETTT